MPDVGAAIAVDPANTPASHPLSLDSIEFAIAGRTILRDVSLQVRPREIVCLLGQSGCGKTTLLRVAAGIERQMRGRVTVDGRVVADDGVYHPPEARRLGFVFQDLALFPHMRVADNVAYGLGGMRRAEALRRAGGALEQVGLAGYDRAYPHQLSGGQQQRVALARALLPAPKVVLFDEPFSGLDRGLRDTVREDVLAVLRQREATAVIVTHDPEEALAMADRIALMRAGRIVQIGSPEEVWRWPIDLEAARVFSTVNAFHARVAGGLAETPVGRVPVGQRADGEALTIAFRPEAIRVFPTDREAGVEVAVERRRFFGTHVELTARVGGVALALQSDPYQVPHADTVRLVPDLRQAIVLEGHQ
ncbi:ABC transporter ATP-binding protein [Acuticoccus sp. I52.16.1]|uniref:ABC transporter ATP-binding protein n=1 Tax=Acuticoccus sp. I52.16.1 TaxID=2928472 RepID=UPI001FD44F42|nr:ABC transporter ATP-binding protein [Acuticoccus sp. I52.16.1]UOM34537.1 ABC transporter ATP-binding protein [Acuticoccus sp. I52.16.1]